MWVIFAFLKLDPQHCSLTYYQTALLRYFQTAFLLIRHLKNVLCTFRASSSLKLLDLEDLMDMFST
jgi:hypothetical protein